MSKAASISKSDWNEITTSPSMPTPESLGSMPLSLVYVFLLNRPRDDGDGPAVRRPDFEYASPRPKPVQVAQAIGISSGKGYVSFIQPEYITERTVEEDGNTAHGTVEFAADSLYSGRVHFVARRQQGGWVIEEFHLPDTRLRLQRREDGTWGNMARAIRG